jgi:acetyl coenzyme A synthetase (ADP forming)-like protein
MGLEKFFNPSSIAVIGASRKKNKLGRIIFEQIITGGYKGKLYPVNPKAKKIAGFRCFASVKDIKGKLDLAIVVVPAPIVPKVVEECIEKRIEAIVIISSGFSETGTKEGRNLENQLKELIKKSRSRIIGPNCIGIFNPSKKLDMLFLSQKRMKRPKLGSISFISQSGAVGSTILDWLAEENVGISKFVSYGNAVDVDECDLIEYLAKDKDTKVITMYLEGIKAPGKKFMKVIRKVSKKKPIIVLKAGKTEKGTKAVASHTGSLAGSAKIYSAAFKQTGIVEAYSWEELFDFAKAFATQPLPRGDKLAIITDGGGFGVLATDEAERQGLKLVEPSKALKEKLRKQMPSYVILHNPIDLTGDATAERYRVAIETCLKSGEFDGIVAITLFQVPTLGEEVVDFMIKLNKKYKKPLLCCAAGSEFTMKLSNRLELAGIPVYETPERAVKVFAAMVKYKNWLKHA